MNPDDYFDSAMAPPWGAEAYSEDARGNVLEPRLEGGGAAAAGPEPPRYLNVPLVDMKWTAEPELSDTPEWCFLCEVGDTGHQNGHYQRLLDYIAQHYTRVSDEALCADVQDLYNRTLRPYLDVPRPWYRRSILAHIEKHAATPLTMTQKSVRMLTEALRVLEDGGLRLRHSNGLEPDDLNKPNTKLYLELLAARERLMKGLAPARASKRNTAP